VSNDRRVVARSLRQCPTVTDLLLNRADDGSFGALGDGEDVADVEGRLLAAVDEGAGGDTLGSDESLFSELVLVGVSEDDDSQGRTSDA